MRNKDFIEDWCDNPSMVSSCGHISSADNKLFSYNTCICQYDAGIYYVNITRYSVATSRHLRYLVGYLDNCSKRLVEIDNIARDRTRLI